jgi:hypothetical protein
MWDGKVIMSKPISCACDIVFKVTLLPCPFRASNYILVKENILGTYFLKKKMELLEQERSHPCHFLQCHVSPWFIKFNVVILQSFSLKM